MLSPKPAQSYCLGSCIVGGAGSDDSARTHQVYYSYCFEGWACSYSSAGCCGVGLSFNDRRCQADVLELL